MKRCPECRRDYYDDSLLYCLDDGNALLEGPATADEPATAILSEPGAVAAGFRTDGESSESKTAILSHAGAEAEPQSILGELSERQSLSAHRAAKPQGKVGSRQQLLAVVGIAVIILVGGFFGYRYFAPNKQIESIAVMPFVNESGNPDVEYLSDGMTETLIRNLSQLPGLNVKARSSVFRYKGKETDAKTIGRELGVQAVLNGRLVGGRGEQLHLSLELVDAQTENIIWTDEYDRRPSDLILLLNAITRDVSGKLKIKLSGSDQQNLAKSYTTDSEAYRLYLQGRFYWNKRAGREFNKAEAYFRQAIEKDPNFALGYVGLADIDEDRERPKKKEYILRALALDDQLAEAHASLGYQYMLDYDWAASERELKRSMELNPNYPQAHQWNGSRLMMLGRHDEALASYRRALEIDPTSTAVNFGYGVCLYYSGRTAEGIGQMKKIVDMEPTFLWSHTLLSRFYLVQGNYAAAVEERAKSLELDDRADDARSIRESFAKNGWNGYLREMIRQLDIHPGTSHTLRVSLLAQLGEKEEAITELVKGANEGDYWLFAIKSDPTFDSLRGDPRFQELLKKFETPQ